MRKSESAATAGNDKVPPQSPLQADSAWMPHARYPGLVWEAYRGFYSRIVEPDQQDMARRDIEKLALPAGLDKADFNARLSAKMLASPLVADVRRREHLDKMDMDKELAETWKIPLHRAGRKAETVLAWCEELLPRLRPAPISALWRTLPHWQPYPRMYGFLDAAVAEAPEEQGHQRDLIITVLEFVKRDMERDLLAHPEFPLTPGMSPGERREAEARNKRRAMAKARLRAVEAECRKLSEDTLAPDRESPAPRTPAGEREQGAVAAQPERR